jgi:ribose 1,5-bisphosphokinase
VSRRGVLFLVVGPSGVGKDSLIQGARRRLADDPRFVFPRRFITRPPDPDGEDHQAVDEAAFDELLVRGDFTLTWSAHGLRYGIPSEVAAFLGSGRNVVVNVSRSVVDEARASLSPVRVLQVRAPRRTLRERLRIRGREEDDEIERRLDRADAHDIGGDDVRVLVNDGPLECSIRLFSGALEEGLLIARGAP